MFPMIPADNIVETFLSIAFVLIAFISWIVRLAGQKKEDAEARARMERARRQERARAQGDQTRTPQSVRSEIDAFLKRSTQGGGLDEPREVELQVVPEEELRQRRQRPNRERKQDRPAARRETRERGNLTSGRKSLAERASSPSGGSPSPKIGPSPSEPNVWHEIVFTDDSTADGPVAAEATQVADSAPRSVGGSPKLKKTSESVQTNAPPLTGARVRDVAALLRNPRTVKEAIVISEVLRRPRGLRS